MTTLSASTAARCLDGQHAEDWLYPTFVTGGSENVGGFSDVQIDAALEDAVTETNPTDRETAWQYAEGLINDQAPVATLYPLQLTPIMATIFNPIFCYILVALVLLGDCRSSLGHTRELTVTIDSGVPAEVTVFQAESPERRFVILGPCSNERAVRVVVEEVTLAGRPQITEFTWAEDRGVPRVIAGRIKRVGLKFSQPAEMIVSVWRADDNGVKIEIPVSILKNSAQEVFRALATDSDVHQYMIISAEAGSPQVEQYFQQEMVDRSQLPAQNSMIRSGETSLKIVAGEEAFVGSIELTFARQRK